jgi:hypothetical protein
MALQVFGHSGIWEKNRTKSSGLSNDKNHEKGLFSWLLKMTLRFFDIYPIILKCCIREIPCRDSLFPYGVAQCLFDQPLFLALSSESSIKGRSADSSEIAMAQASLQQGRRRINIKAKTYFFLSILINAIG